LLGERTVVNFVVIGPFDVPTIKGNNGGRILERKQELKSAVQKVAADSKICNPGCYVFSCTASRGSIPLYVGKATRNILAEAFNERNINNLNHFLLNRQRGRIQLYAIYQKKVKMLFGNPDLISQIEEFMIGFAARRNRDLLNIHGTGVGNWSIAGVVNNGSGKPDAAARAFRKMMGMQARATPKSPKAASGSEEDEIQAVNVESETPNTPEVVAIDEETKEPEPVG
jgi:hypothetical protein